MIDLGLDGVDEQSTALSDCQFLAFVIIRPKITLTNWENDSH